MGSKRLIEKTTKTVSGIKLTQYVNDEKRTNFDDITECVAGLGLTIVGMAVSSPLAAFVTSSVGIALGTNALIDMVVEAFDDNDLESTIDKMKEGDKLKITTKFYEWLSSSGNNVAYYADVKFEII